MITQPDSEQTKTETYQIHDNGGRPFAVMVTPSGGVTVIGGKGHPEPGRHLLSFNVDEVLVPPGETNSNSNRTIKPWPGGRGNTVLLRLKPDESTPPNTYVWIGRKIIQFKTLDRVVEFRSIVGNSNVPYPYALTEKNTYLLPDIILNRPIEDDPWNHYFHGGETSSPLPQLSLLPSPWGNHS